MKCIVCCPNVDYKDSFIAVRILHLLINAKLIYYAFCFSDKFITIFVFSRRMLRNSVQMNTSEFWLKCMKISFVAPQHQ